ncbi:MAG TPA: NAD-dependent epimerase/dehydratase family protein [Myxococcaceae bacterium]|nr:NAD-dependent epimerase/dehydratase family protein [Myxococcaceae bacterium]
MKHLVTGGAGFIGCNAVKRWLDAGHEVVVVDDLSRRGADQNLAWLRSQPGRLTFERVDIRDGAALDACLLRHRDAGVVLHLAAQVAVTTSVSDPRHDFEVNALGTFNLLESVRRHAREAVVLYASTNKVYGGLETEGVEEHAGRYRFRERPGGIPESQPLDFHSPYGCSKGAADQYVRDYARIYGLRTVCFRQSCIYGYRQFGVEDQGWVAWFTIAAVTGQPVCIYGDGKQVRDLLFIDDLCDAYDAAAARADGLRGGVFNLGGGPANTLSLLELVTLLEQLTGRPLAPRFADWRPGDQPVFVADVSRAAEALAWRPTTDVETGVRRLHAWVEANRSLFS